MQNVSVRTLAQGGFLALLLTFAAQAVDARTRAECEQQYQPQRGQSGKDVIWWPTDDGLVVRMLKLAEVSAKDRLYDLGAGDGRIAITAAKQFGARAIGIEYEAGLVNFGNCLAEAAGVSDRVELRRGDIFETDFSDATVVTLYLLSELNLRLRPALLDMKPGTRVVSHSFTMGEWEPDGEVSHDTGQAYLWIVPAKVAGRWSFRAAQAQDTFDVDLKQEFQRVQGAAGSAQLTDLKLRGPKIEFAFNEGGASTRVAGEVVGNEIRAKVTRGGKTSDYIGTRS
jgi:SAM-dependent methyltransferase